MKARRSPLLLHAAATAIVALHAHASTASPAPHLLLLHSTAAALNSAALTSAALRAAAVALIRPGEDSVPHYLPDASVAWANAGILGMAGLWVQHVVPYSFIQ